MTETTNEFLTRSHEASAQTSSRMWSACYFQSFYNPTCTPGSQSSMKGQLIICTGGNCGIGFETVKELALRGADVIIAARNQQRNEECVATISKLLTNSTGSISYVRLDLSDLNSIGGAVSEIKSRFPDRKVDQLIQNAGIWPTSFSTSPQGHEICYATNVLGPHLLFQLLHRSLMLHSSCRLILVTGDIYITVNDSTSDYQYSDFLGCEVAYSRSKLGLMWMASQYHLLYPHYQIYLVHPGIVASDLFVTSSSSSSSSSSSWFSYLSSIISYLKDLCMINCQQGAQVTLICSTSPLDDLVNGGYYHNTCGRMILSDDDPANNLHRAQEFYQMTDENIQSYL